MIIHCFRACLSLLLHRTCKGTGVSKHYHLPPLQKHAIMAKKSEYNILQGLEALIRWMKDAKAEMCTSWSSDLVLKLGHNNIYINKSAFYRHSNQIKKIKFPLQSLFVKNWRRISKVTENYCNLYCCIYWFLYLFMGWVISSIIKLHWYQIAPIMT